jgi:NodT family efflux transporter outer membrane factor (OMF) lipoprotein
MSCSSSAVAGAWLAGALLAGCMAGPNFVTPPATAVTRYTLQPMPGIATVETAGQGQALPPVFWWQLLQSAQLDATVQAAVEGNRDLKATRAALAQADALTRASDAALYPNVELNAGAGRQKLGAESLGSFNLPPFSYYAVGASVSYLFDFSGGVRRSIEAQRARDEAQRHEADAATLALSGEVVMQALQVASARAQIESVEELLDDDREDLRLAQDAFDAGSGTRVDTLSARSQLANDETQLPPLRRELAVAQHALALLVGRAPADWSAPNFSLAEFVVPQPLPLSLPSELAHRRPDILAAEGQLHAATADVGVATANLYPQVSLGATGGPQAVVLRTLFDASAEAGGFTAGLVAPLFDHGALRARRSAAQQAQAAALARYQQVVLRAFGQVADALESLAHDDELLQSEQSAVTVAADSLSLTRESYSVGNSGVLQVLEAQRQSQQARLGLVRAEAQRDADAVALLLALGGRAPRSEESPPR